MLPAPLDYGDAPFTGSWENPPANTGDVWLRVTFNELEPAAGSVGMALGRDACKHCGDAPCITVCPSGAMHRTNMGAVAIDADKCIGCEYCVAACPFHVPKLCVREHKSRKCSMCVDRIDAGRSPACVKSCPGRALQFGGRNEMVMLAQNRALAIRNQYPDVQVYGVNEMGGMGVIAVLPYGAKAHGLPLTPEPPLVTRLQGVLPVIGGVGALGAVGVVSLALLGGRGSQYGNEQYTYDPVTRITCDGGKPMDPDAPIVKVGLKDAVKDEVKSGEKKVESEVSKND